MYVLHIQSVWTFNYKDERCFWKRNKFIFTHSKKNFIYYLILFGFVFMMNYFNISYLTVLLKRGTLNNFQFYISFARNEFAVAVSVIIILQFYMKQERFILLTDKILILKKLLVVFDEKIYFDENRLLMQDIIHFCLINIFPFVLFVILYQIYFYNGIICLVAKFSCELVINYAFVQYIIVLMFINHFLKIINKNFYRILIKSSKPELEKFANFSRMHNYYFSLCELSEKVSDFYNFSLFFCITYVFMNLLVFSYYTIKTTLTNQFSAAKMGSMYIVHCLQIIPLCYFVNLSHKISNKY